MPISERADMPKSAVMVKDATARSATTSKARAQRMSKGHLGCHTANPARTTAGAISDPAATNSGSSPMTPSARATRRRHFCQGVADAIAATDCIAAKKAKPRTMARVPLHVNSGSRAIRRIHARATTPSRSPSARKIGTRRSPALAAKDCGVGRAENHCALPGPFI